MCLFTSFIVFFGALTNFLFFRSSSVFNLFAFVLCFGVGFNTKTDHSPAHHHLASIAHTISLSLSLLHDLSLPFPLLFAYHHTMNRLTLLCVVLTVGAVCAAPTPNCQSATDLIKVKGLF